MANQRKSVIFSLIERHHQRILDDWIQQMRHAGVLSVDAGEGGETRTQAAQFLSELQKAAERGQFEDISAPEWAPTREVLDALSRSRALSGFTPSQTATFVFSLKAPLFAELRRELSDNAERFATETWAATQLLDKLGLYTTEVFQKSREDVIARQQEELMEISTPVVRLWDGIVALPLIGTLDSARTQVVMENLLQQIVSTGAEIAIIDITGVPTVDTLVAQHLIKTVSAARLMGADCIISGIRPQIAQTIVHLGVDLSVVSKATMAGAFKLALQRLGKTVVERTKPGAPRPARAHTEEE
jgi:rsbT co-antagonist protein RsbR